MTHPRRTSDGRLFVVALSCATLALACQPKFEPKGSLTIDGAAFSPTSCQVLSGHSSIELADAKGARLGLSLPPQNLNAFQDISGTPSASYTAPGGQTVELGACGSLTLTGEGYHGSGKRAASGKMSLSCASPKVAGELSFSGCF